MLRHGSRPGPEAPLCSGVCLVFDLDGLRKGRACCCMTELHCYYPHPPPPPPITLPHCDQVCVGETERWRGMISFMQGRPGGPGSFSEPLNCPQMGECVRVNWDGLDRSWVSVSCQLLVGLTQGKVTEQADTRRRSCSFKL